LETTSRKKFGAMKKFSATIVKADGSTSTTRVYVVPNRDSTENFEQKDRGEIQILESGDTAFLRIDLVSGSSARTANRALEELADVREVKISTNHRDTEF
jgi:hypothetical protein